MAVQAGPLDLLRDEIQEASTGPGLSAPERVAKLRFLRERLVDLVGETDAYIGDLERSREAEYAQVADDVAYVRENADMRGEMLSRGLATEEELDALGFLSHETLDELREEGRLLEAVGTIRKFAEKLHPRDRTGKFKDKPGALHLLPKGRSGRGTPKVLHTHEDGVDKRRRSRLKKEVERADRDERRSRRTKRPTPEVESRTLEKRDYRKEIEDLDKRGVGAKSEAARREYVRQRAELTDEMGMRSEQEPWEVQLDKPVVPDFYGDTVDWQTAPGRAGGGTQREPTPEEIQADLRTAREIGLNDWPDAKDDPLAARILGVGVKDTEGKFLKTIPGDPHGQKMWTEERAALHDKIIDVLLRERQLDDKGKPSVLDPNGGYLKPAPGEDGRPRVLFMGGGTASGKTTAQDLEETKELQPESAVLIDPDEIKGMLPEYHDFIENGSRYAASGVHEESSHLAKRLQREAMARGLNVIVDGTSDSPMDEAKPASMTKQTEKLRQFKNYRSESVADGYHVSMFYVSAPTNLAIVRATSRAMRSGRWVPEPEIRSIHQGVSDRFDREVRPEIERGSDLIDNIMGYDTTQAQPVRMFHLDESGKLVIDSPDTYETFLRKKDEEPHAEEGELHQLF